MTHGFSEQILLLIADYADWNHRVFSWRNLGVSPDAPWLHRHRRLIERSLRDQRRKKQAYTTLAQLKKNGFLISRKINNTTGYLLTPKGEMRALSIRLRKLPKPKLPKNQWVMVLFDIPESLRRQRDRLRRSLRWLGFTSFQRSVWISRYDQSKSVQSVIRFHRLQRFVKLLTVQELPT